MKRRGRTPHPRVAGTSGAALSYAREAKGITLCELGRLAGVSGSMVSGYERGRYVPRYVVAARMAVALGVTVASIWPTLARDVEVKGRLLDTVIPFETAARVRVVKQRRALRLAFAHPEGGHSVTHEHRPPLCCGSMWCRHVDLSDPETYRVVGEPTRIPASSAGAV